jgi:hypothetical protein
MPAVAIVPAISAIKQANDGHKGKFLSVIHAILLLGGIGAAMWIYPDKDAGLAILERIAAMP